MLRAVACCGSRRVRRPQYACFEPKSASRADVSGVPALDELDSAGRNACFSVNATVRRSTQSERPTGKFWPKVATPHQDLGPGDHGICRAFRDGASRTRTGGLLGAIRARAGLESRRFAGLLASTRRVRPGQNARGLPAITGSLSPKTPLRGQTSAPSREVPPPTGPD
jgi:hypothetical protein